MVTIGVWLNQTLAPEKPPGRGSHPTHCGYRSHLNIRLQKLAGSIPLSSAFKLRHFRGKISKEKYVCHIVVRSMWRPFLAALPYITEEPTKVCDVPETSLLPLLQPIYHLRI